MPHSHGMLMPMQANSCQLVQKSSESDSGNNTMNILPLSALGFRISSPCPLGTLALDMKFHEDSEFLE